jgi:hypothetical protein
MRRDERGGGYDMKAGEDRKGPGQGVQLSNMVATRCR